MPLCCRLSNGDSNVMISYFSKMYQAVPSLIGLQASLGGTFVTTRPATLRAIRRVHPQAPVQLMRQWWPSLYQGYQTLMQSDLVVTGSPNNGILKQFPAKKAMVFHGTFAPLSVDEIRRMAHFDYLCTIGPRMQAIVEQAGMQDKVIETGYLPFLQYPVRNLTQRASFLQSLHMDPALPLVLYLPAGRPIGSWEFLAQALVQQLPAQQYNLLLRPHPSHAVTARRSDRANFKRLQQLSANRPNTLLDLTTQDIAMLYACADLIISDGTSPAEESLYYDTPQLLVESPLYGYTRARQILADKHIDAAHQSRVLTVYEIGPSMHVHTPSLLKEVAQALATQSQYAAARTGYFEFVFGHAQFGTIGQPGKLHRQQHLLDVLQAYQS